MIIMMTKMTRGMQNADGNFDDEKDGMSLMAKIVIVLVRMVTNLKRKLFADKKHLKRKREGWPLRGLKSCQSSHI